jgi:hypothetical protein
MKNQQQRIKFTIMEKLVMVGMMIAFITWCSNFAMDFIHAFKDLIK